MHATPSMQILTLDDPNNNAKFEKKTMKRHLKWEKS